ncbi:MAG: SRPBCC family protein [Thaumarchaeota archaeon]|nr:SRPBCC family protein [Nitrososphaerota archaeon]
MVRYARMQDVKAPREKVFHSLMQVERLPQTFPEIFAKMEVVGMEGTSRVILCDELWAGRHFRYKMKESVSPPDRIDRSITEGNGKGSKTTFTLDQIPSGTRVSMTMDGKGLAVALLARLFRSKFEKEISHVFDGYMKVVESSGGAS